MSDMWGNSYTVSYVIEHKRGFFSRAELEHILVASAVLILDFLILYRGTVFINGFYLQSLLLFAVLAVVTGFLLHEMAHKVVAMKYGCSAEFRSTPFFLLISLATSFIGFLFAAPGAVYISGNVTRSENGTIGIAGPLTNFAFALSFLGLTFVTSPFHTIFIALALMNLFFAIFNMIPVYPLDGEKVFKWDKVRWGSLFIVSIALFLYLIA